MDNRESELLRSAQNGDDQAFGELVEPYVDRSFRIALRNLHREAEAEDAVQEAFVKAWRALGSFRGDAKFSTWLYRIVWRVSVDMGRKRESLPLEVDLTDSATERDPERRWESIERRSELDRAMNDLPDAYRTVLTLFYIEDLPVRDIAGILGLPVGTVKTHLHRARIALKERLSHGRIGEGDRQ